MRRYTMFIEWHTQYCQDVNSLKLICRFNAIPNKIPLDFSGRICQADSKIHEAKQTVLDDQSNVVKEQSWKIYITWLQELL